MKFIIYKASDEDFKETRDIKSLEELITFYNEVGYELIIGDSIINDEPTLTIYDYYLE